MHKLGDIGKGGVDLGSSDLKVFCHHKDKFDKYGVIEDNALSKAYRAFAEAFNHPDSTFEQLNTLAKTLTSLLKDQFTNSPGLNFIQVGSKFAKDGAFIEKVKEDGSVYTVSTLLNLGDNVDVVPEQHEVTVLGRIDARRSEFPGEPLFDGAKPSFLLVGGATVNSAADRKEKDAKLIQAGCIIPDGTTTLDAFTPNATDPKFRNLQEQSRELMSKLTNISIDNLPSQLKGEIKAKLGVKNVTSVRFKHGIVGPTGANIANASRLEVKTEKGVRYIWIASNLDPIGKKGESTFDRFVQLENVLSFSRVSPFTDRLEHKCFPTDETKSLADMEKYGELR